MTDLDRLWCRLGGDDYMAQNITPDDIYRLSTELSDREWDCGFYKCAEAIGIPKRYLARLSEARGHVEMMTILTEYLESKSNG